MAVLDEPAAVRRLYDRLGFSAGGERLAAAQRRGFADGVARLLRPSGTDAGVTRTPPPDLPVLTRPAEGADDASRAARKEYRRRRRAQQQAAAWWWLERMAAADQPARERLTWFWHGHFATSMQKVKRAELMLRQNETLRRLGMGDFGSLAQAMVVDPAMLVWLDGNDNTAGAPNENLAREFMELFTLGRDGYAESDVREGARALTGWTLERDTGRAVLRRRRHDSGAKTVLGRTGEMGAEEFVAAVLEQPGCAPFVTGRLWSRLVSAEPPAPAVRDRLVEAYGAGRDITALLAALVREPAFTDPASGLVKQPVEWLVGLFRALALSPAALTAEQRKRVLGQLRGLGQVPFRPPSVAGWPQGGAWLTGAAALARTNAARLLAGAADLSALGRTSARHRPEAARRLLGVDRWTERTRSALAQVADRPAAVVAVAACSPEYVVSG